MKRIVMYEDRLIIKADGNNISGTSETSVCVDSGKPLTDRNVLFDYAKKTQPIKNSARILHHTK
jgi:hypothetical protein